MTRFFLTLCLTFFMFSSAWAMMEDDDPQFKTGPDYTSTTSDPAHKGWYLNQEYGTDVAIEEEATVIEWTDVKTKCAPCKGLVSSYNDTMRSVMRLRYEIAMIVDTDRAIRESREKFDMRELGGKPGDKLGKYEERLAAKRLAAQIARQELREQMLPGMRAQLAALETLATNMRGQIKECEKQCKKGKEGGTGVVVGGGTTGGDPAVNPLPFDWKGPYPEVCFKCAKLAGRLNSLPGLYYKEKAALEKQKAVKILAQLKIRRIRAEFEDHVSTIKLVYNNEPKKRDEAIKNSRKHANKGIAAQEEVVKKAEKEIARHEANIAEINRNFKATLTLYNKCVPTCKTDEKVGCFFPETEYRSINVGANSEVGTGKAMENKIKGQAKGMALGALGGLMGGGGMSLGSPGGQGPIGSPGGGNRNKGPKTEKDPTKGDFKDFISKHEGIEHHAGVEAGGRFILVNDELIASVELGDVPGNGTFHAMWLETPEGKIIWPTRYLIFSLYQDWKLTVWWTYDRWVDGQHVEHDQGEEVSFGRNDLGNVAMRFEGEEGIQNSIWNRLGFGTAVKGVDHIGAVFPVTAAALKGPCPYRLVTHVTLPKEDPVITQPIILDFNGSDVKGGSGSGGKSGSKKKSGKKKTPRKSSFND